MHGAEQHVERVPVEQPGHLVHAAPDEVDLEAEHDREALGLGRQRHLDVAVEVGAELLVPAAPMASRIAGRVVGVVPPAAEEASTWRSGGSAR